MTDSLRISLVQAPVAWENPAANLALYGSLIGRHAAGKADLAVLPEMFATGFTMNAAALSETMDGPTLTAAGFWAKAWGLAVCGSFIAREGGRYYNRAFLVGPAGEAAFCDKRHLFGPAGEDACFTRGAGRPVLSYLGWNICLQVCYDLRFPVWSRNAGNAYDLLVYVANWPRSRTGAWRTLLPARAVENMAYVCGVNRTGTDAEGRRYDGYSAVYSPKGETLAQAGEAAETVCTCVLHKSSLERLRSAFPAWKDADLFTFTPDENS
jgi:predicted amidohydrolase